MRLKDKDIEAIKKVAKLVFGENSTIKIFGSRTDDERRGGDIDLLIRCDSALSRADQYQRKINFLVQLKKIIGDQKIDVIIDSGQQNNPVFQDAYKKGVQL